MSTTELTYTQAITELEQIVARMQRDDCDIDSLAGYTSRALELLKLCKQKLFKADEDVKRCLEELQSTLAK
ncbi:MAG: exodeoxyribonuclease VII small subunit [Muribaculaceae bacterium]|nr:exodeoxyribonuclease VII small subunit [Muribaculaceae bacterium]MDE6803663.1 exodeoxyribonuclease VII small subunit [Muribaculaceae bacterium]MDE6843715.1 exodeoxyribonuclease VII small subunit [Muribaculaceae bacterium]MDE7189647.1 exodeoxyribonuclease VII small subunit [Muribaculaceae bacterium]